MNGLQSFSKRLKERLQISVKKLFSGGRSGEFENDRGGSEEDGEGLGGSEEAEEGAERPRGSRRATAEEARSGVKTSSTKSLSERCNNPLVCPTGRHTNVNQDDLCTCIHIQLLSFHQTQPIIYVWHKFKSEPTMLQSLKLENPIICVQGGQGVVFWVVDTKNNRNFALKMKLRETKSKSSWLIEQRESKVLRKIQHNFIVNLFHVYESADAMFLTMEYLNGGCLWSHIAKKGTLPESYTVYYSACIIDALKYLHEKKIVYRDLKAENIVLDSLGRPKLIDFGMAKKIRKHSKGFSNDEETEKYPATQYYFAAYLAPEIYTKPSSANIFIDSWGIGYVISELLLGYGVFISMPWENLENKTMKENWTFKLDYEFTVSTQCIDFLDKMLVCDPTSRMSIDDSIDHPFFSQVRWSTLVYIKPPNLSVFLDRVKGSKVIRAVLNSENNTSSFFEFCDLQLPDPILTPNSNINCIICEASTPKDTPINPNAPSIKSPNFIKKGSHISSKYKNMSNNLKYDIYRALCVNNSEVKKSTVDTISNLKPNRKL